MSKLKAENLSKPLQARCIKMGDEAVVAVRIEDDEDDICSIQAVIRLEAVHKPMRWLNNAMRLLGIGIENIVECHRPKDDVDESTGSRWARVAIEEVVNVLEIHDMHLSQIAQGISVDFHEDDYLENVGEECVEEIMEEMKTMNKLIKAGDQNKVIEMKEEMLVNHEARKIRLHEDIKFLNGQNKIYCQLVTELRDIVGNNRHNMMSYVELMRNLDMVWSNFRDNTNQMTKKEYELAKDFFTARCNELSAMGIKID